ncbi:MAG: SEL1-like repeat protein [Sphingobacteriia bacterium]
MGEMHLTGTGVPKDYAQAAYWTNKAYSNGDKRAEELWNKHKLWKYR